MKPLTTDEVLSLLDGSFTASALGAAFELGLFWLLDAQPLSAAEVSARLGVPGNRCRYWLQLLERAGLLRNADDGYAPSSVARKCILEAYSQDTWAFLAMEAREAFPALRDLALHIRNSGSATDALGFVPRNYVEAMAEDTDRARRFTRMLYELHQPIAEELARCLDLGGVSRFMDLGGGSGVVSLALLHRHAGCQAVVVDIEPVCRVGREIAEDSGVGGRITYHPTDFTREELPGGFDVVLECDVGEYGPDLFRKVRSALKPHGRFIIVDQFSPSPGSARPGHLRWAFERSLRDPGFSFRTAAEVCTELDAAGFEILSEKTITASDTTSATFDSGHTIIEAQVA